MSDEEESDNSSSIDTLLNEKNINIKKLNEINAKCVDLIYDEKFKKSLNIYKKIENFLENAVMDNVTLLIPKKFVIIVLYNLATCFYKLKNLENSIIYLDAVIYHFDTSLEKKYKIKINEEFFDSLIKNKKILEINTKIGDWILELRFCAKFHIQMSVILSEAKRYVDSLKHAKLAALICEDNLIKTLNLYQKIKSDFKLKENGGNSNTKENYDIKQQIKNNYKIILDLNKIINNLRNNSNHINNSISFNTNKNKIKSVYNNYFTYIKNITEKKEKEKIFSEKKNSNNYYISYSKYRNKKINLYNNEKNIINDINNIFEKKFVEKDDWITLLNINNIIYLSPLNYDDLDLESEPKYELLRDAILEKVIMLTMSYYLLSERIRILSTDKNNKNKNGEYYLSKAVNLAFIFLPPSCPIINHYKNIYNKYYINNLEIIPEGKIADYNINLEKKEIVNNNNNDFIYFIKTEKIKYIKNNNIKYQNNNKNEILFNNKINISNSNIFNNNNKKKNNLINNISNESSQISINHNTSLELNGNLNLITNNKFLERTNKSKIQDIKAPKFKLNFNKISNNNNNLNIKYNSSTIINNNGFKTKRINLNKRKKLNIFNNSTNTKKISYHKYSKIANLAKYFNIKNNLNLNKEYLTDRKLNTKTNYELKINLNSYEKLKTKRTDFDRIINKNKNLKKKLNTNLKKTKNVKKMQIQIKLMNNNKKKKQKNLSNGRSFPSDNANDDELIINNQINKEKIKKYLKNIKFTKTCVEKGSKSDRNEK